MLQFKPLPTNTPLHQAVSQAAILGQRGDIAELEHRIRRGCTGCNNPLIEVRGDKLQAVPGARIIYAWDNLVGSPYCGLCLYRMGLACMPGDDYAI